MEDKSTSTSIDSGNKSEESTPKRLKLSQTKQNNDDSPVSKSILLAFNTTGAFTSTANYLFLNKFEKYEENKQKTALKRMHMAIDIAMNLITVTDELLSSAIENVHYNAALHSTDGKIHETDGFVFGSPKLKSPQHNSWKGTSSPLTQSICEMNLGIGTFVATANNEIIKNFKTTDVTKRERLDKLRKASNFLLETLEGMRTKVAPKMDNLMSNDDFKWLPTNELMILSESEKQQIKSMRRCTKLKETVQNEVELHSNCVEKCQPKVKLSNSERRFIDAMHNCQSMKNYIEKKLEESNDDCDKMEWLTKSLEPNEVKAIESIRSCVHCAKLCEISYLHYNCPGNCFISSPTNSNASEN